MPHEQREGQGLGSHVQVSRVAELLGSNKTLADFFWGVSHDREIAVSKSYLAKVFVDMNKYANIGGTGGWRS